MSHDVQTKGILVSVLGNLVQVKFEGGLSQGETAFIEMENAALKAEVLEIRGNIAKLQVFEETKGLKLGQKVRFTKELLAVELGPGLLGRIYDGLQNPLEILADISGIYLPRGQYVEALDRVKKWEVTHVAKIGDELFRGDTIITVKEFRFDHQIMLPFKFYGKYKLTWLIAPGSYTVDTVIAKVKDQNGKEYPITMVQTWPVKNALLQGKRKLPTKLLSTGIRIIDTMNPIMMGGTACTPGPFGAGKTVIQHCVSKYSNAQIIIVVGCGERASELVEVLKTFPQLVDHYTNEPLMNRTLIIANTSSMPVAAREASLYVGMTIAEYYRQMGIDVLLLGDSTSRWAQGMRELSGRLEEIPADECFPAYLQSRIASFYQRSGVVELNTNTQKNKDGSVTFIGAVSPSGGQWQVDPVTIATLKVVDVFLCLSREFAGKRRYPSIDPKLSYSSSIEKARQLVNHDLPDWGEWVDKAKKFIVEGDAIERRMEVIGLEGTSISDYVIYLKSELFSFCYLQQNAFDSEDVYCSFDQQKRQFTLVQKIFNLFISFSTHDEARAYYLDLQNQVRSLNFMPFNSSRYNQVYREIETKLEESTTQEAINR